MIATSKYMGSQIIPVRFNIDETKKLVSVADALKGGLGGGMSDKPIKGPTGRHQKQRVTLRQSPDAQLALGRMITQGRRSKDIIESINKNFNIKVYPCDLSRTRREMGVESPHGVKINAALSKKEQGQQVTKANPLPPPEVTVRERKPPNMAQIIKLLQRELKRSGIASAVVHAKGSVKLEMG